MTDHVTFPVFGAFHPRTNVTSFQGIIRRYNDSRLIGTLQDTQFGNRKLVLGVRREDGLDFWEYSRDPYSLHCAVLEDEGQQGRYSGFWINEDPFRPVRFQNNSRYKILSSFFRTTAKTFLTQIEEGYSLDSALDIVANSLDLELMHTLGNEEDYRCVLDAHALLAREGITDQRAKRHIRLQRAKAVYSLQIMS